MKFRLECRLVRAAEKFVRSVKGHFRIHLCKVSAIQNISVWKANNPKIGISSQNSWELWKVVEQRGCWCYRSPPWCRKFYEFFMRKSCFKCQHWLVTDFRVYHQQVYFSTKMLWGLSIRTSKSHRSAEVRSRYWPRQNRLVRDINFFVIAWYCGALPAPSLEEQ